MFKESKTGINPCIKAVVDTGYQGLQKRHTNTLIPKKRSKKQPLTPQDKQNNGNIAAERVVVENVIRSIKIFRIMAERYRNRRKRFALRVNLIAAIYNFQL